MNDQFIQGILFDWDKIAKTRNVFAVLHRALFTCHYTKNSVQYFQQLNSGELV